MTRYFTGVGSRETPKHILDLMRRASAKFASSGLVLRSGGADGADAAFYHGWCDSANPNKPLAEIYLPWNGFNNLTPEKDPCNRLVTDGALLEQAWSIVKLVHPGHHNLSRGAKALHTRNVFQVLGQDLQTPSSFLVCYAPVDKGGNPKGGTATAINIAKLNKIPVLNLHWHEARNKLHRLLEND